MTQQNTDVRVRFAPSPTGELHIGSLRTALTNYLFAKKHGGTFIVRCEDTDQSRLVEGAAERQIADMLWAGLTIDEGVMLDAEGKRTECGEYGPYTQSNRRDIYQKYVQQLVDEGKAYHCFCTPERLDAMRKTQQQNKQAPKYDRKCLSLTKEDIDARIAKGEKYVIRFKVPEGQTSFDDLVYGHITVDNATLDDQVIMKSDGLPTYHLAVVVDDYLMRISHVFRGTEWIASTPKHILLYKAFGWEDAMPTFCHMANILDKTKKKLSKRDGSVSVADFRAEGYPKEAIINFIALLGWNPKTEQEIFTMDELIDAFDTAKMHKAGGIFDRDRLTWMAKEHLRRMSIDDIYDNTLPFLTAHAFYQDAPEAYTKAEYIKKVIAVEHDRIARFSDIGVENPFFFTDDITVTPDIVRWKNNTDAETKDALTRAHDALEAISEDNWTRDNLEQILMDVAGDKRGDFLWPLRAALTGAKRSPSPFDCAWVLGKDKTLQRIENALRTL